MRTLTVFYDPRCGLCASFRAWLEAQPKRITVEFLGYESEAAAQRFPGLREIGADREVVVLADDGRWWQGGPAWLTCLWATRDYQDWSFRLAAPVFEPLIKKTVHLLSENRLTISRLMKLRSDSELAGALGVVPKVRCAGGVCRI